MFLHQSDLDLPKNRKKFEEKLIVSGSMLKEQQSLEVILTKLLCCQKFMGLPLKVLLHTLYACLKTVFL